MLASLLSLKVFRHSVDVKEDRIKQDLEKAQQQTLRFNNEFGQLMIADVSSKRVLTYRVFGVPLRTATEVVLYFHGSPSCHLEAATFAESAQQLGIAIVAPDRPGIGGSTYHRRLSLASFAHDCALLLDQLGVGRLLAVGTSGGGPYATAFAALYPVRCVALGLLAPVAPTDWRKKEHRSHLRDMEGFDRFQLGMAGSLACVYGTPTLWLAHRALRYMAEKRPKTLVEYAPKSMSGPDAALFTTDGRVKDSFAAVLQYAYSGSGARGVSRDIKVLGRKWDICVSTVACRTLIWHGTEDKCVPITHSHWYTTQVQDSELILLEKEGHITVPVRCAPAVLDALLTAARSSPRRLGRSETLSKVEGMLLPGGRVLEEGEQAALLQRVALEQERQAQVEMEERGSEPSESLSLSAAGEEGEEEGGSLPVASEEGSGRGGSRAGTLAGGDDGLGLHSQRVQVVPLS